LQASNAKTKVVFKLSQSLTDSMTSILTLNCILYFIFYKSLFYINVEKKN